MNLTERELDVLACIIIGKQSYRSTSEILKIHKSTVGTHVRKVLAKMECDTTMDLKLYLNTDDLEYRYRELVRNTNDFQKNKILIYLLIAWVLLFFAYFVSKTFFL